MAPPAPEPPLSKPRGDGCDAGQRRAPTTLDSAGIECRKESGADSLPDLESALESYEQAVAAKCAAASQAVAQVVVDLVYGGLVPS